MDPKDNQDNPIVQFKGATADDLPFMDGWEMIESNE